MAVGNSSQILLSALAGCLHCKYHATENSRDCSMEAPEPIWRTPGPMVRLGCGLTAPLWGCFPGAWMRRALWYQAEALTDFGLPLSCNPVSRLACDAPESSCWFSVGFSSSVPKVGISRVWCVSGTSIHQKAVFNV